MAMRSGDRFHQITRTAEGESPRAIFDLATDPGKSRNLYDPRRADQREAIQTLETYRARLLASATSDAQTERLPPEEEIRRLRSLGYLE
jgi:MoxR-like ATPase